MIPTTLERIQFFLLVISFPLYCLYLTTLIKFRHKPPFNSPFFKLCLYLGFSDVLSLCNQWIFWKCVRFNWMGITYFATEYPQIFAKIAMMVAFQLAFTQHLAVISLAINRFTGLVTPLRYQLIWTEKNLHTVVFCVWFLPLVFVSPMMSLDFDYNIKNFTDPIQPMFLDLSAAKTYFTIAAGVNTLLNISTLIMYICMFYTTRKTSSENGQTTVTRDDVTLAIYGFSTFVVMFLFGLYAGLRAAVPISEVEEVVETLTLLYGIASDIFSWCNPWLSLFLLRNVRKHMIATLFCRTHVETAVVNVACAI